jgi:hypothetical protein
MGFVYAGGAHADRQRFTVYKAPTITAARVIDTAGGARKRGAGGNLKKQ